MELIPSEPPGNAQRKLRGLLGQIDGLRQRGYSIRVIHETLLKAGVEVSKATVQRELQRAQSAGSCSKPDLAPGVTLQPHTSEPAASIPLQGSPVPSPEPGEPRPQPLQTVKKMSDVDEFFELHIGNPLLRKKGTP